MPPATFHGRHYYAPDGCFYDDEAEIRDAYWNIQPGDRVVDVGARYGSYAVPAAVCGGDVLAIDSDRRMLVALERAAQENGLSVRTAVYAIGDGSPYPPELGIQVADPFMFMDPYAPAGGTEWSTLDDILDGKVDWIKIDVEGVELAVLRGGLDSLRAYHPRLIIEDHTRVYPWCAEHEIGAKAQDLLRWLGYHVDVVPYEAFTGAPRDFIIAT